MRAFKYNNNFFMNKGGVNPMQIMKYDSGKGAFKNWIVEESMFDERYVNKCEAIFCQGNGYLGVRNALEEKYLKEIRNTFVAGTFNKASKDEVTELPNVPDVTNMELTINGVRFAMNTGVVSDYSRTLNLYTGETVRSLKWTSPAGDEVKLSFHRFVSYDNLHVVASYVEITPLSGDIALNVESGVNGQVTNTGAQHFVCLEPRLYEDEFVQFPVVTTESKVKICVHVAHKLTVKGKPAVIDSNRTGSDRRTIMKRYELKVAKGETLRMEKYATIHSERDLEYAELPRRASETRLRNDGLRLIKKVAKSGYNRLFAKSKAVWASVWADQEIKIDTDDDYAVLAVRFALYHLQIMTDKKDNRIGIGAKGLSGEGYKGHSFWDTETFIFPYFQMAQPEVARVLLEYRYKNLYGARVKAKNQGYEGAMYPWESAWITDGEVTPIHLGVDLKTGELIICWTGLIELHVTADIIYALQSYYTQTGDQEFMDNCGYEMIIDTARFWCSRMEWVEENGRYELLDVIGPDEYKDHVNNNAYTNHMAKYNIDLAVEAIDMLKEEKPEVYAKIEAAVMDLQELKAILLDKGGKLFLPGPDAETGIIPQHDGYFQLKDIDLTKYKTAPVVGTIYKDYSTEEIQGIQVAKQADIVELLYQLEDIVDRDTKEKNYYYYEARTLHDSSLSRAIHSVTACDMGLAEEAYNMFIRAASTDLGTEMRSSNAGIHSANMGGVWQDVVMGFGGVRVVKGELRIAPHIPEQWNSFTYHIYWKGSRLNVTVSKGNKIVIDNQGAAVKALIGGKEVVIESGLNEF